MHDTNQTPMVDLRDIAASIGLLTRLPVPVDFEVARARSSISCWAYPLVGALVGLIAGCVAYLASAIGLPNGIAALLGVISLMLITGGLHEDGLADCADGFWGGATKQRRLQIMKDSTVGVYAILALMSIIGLRWLGLEAVGQTQLIATFAGIGAISRLPLVIGLHMIPNARGSGLSSDVGTAPASSLAIASVIAILLALLCFGLAGLLIIFVAVAASIGVFAVALRKIGGQTGDVLGASQQIAEVSAILAIIIL